MTERADGTDAWSPYGLEPLRQQVLRRRRIVTLALIGVVLIAILALSESTTRNETEVFGNGQKQQLEITLPDEEPEERGPDAQISVSPGRVTAAGAGSYAPPAAGAPSDAPARDLGDPFDWMGTFLAFGPVILIATLAWAGFRPRSAPADEVNFGVYKGAMPLEMITASHAHLVVTQKRAAFSLFGKRRSDYVDEDAPGARRRTSD